MFGTGLILFYRTIQTQPIGEMDALVFVLEHDGSDQPFHGSIRDYMCDLI